MITNYMKQPLLIDSKACKQQQELNTLLCAPSPLLSEQQADLYLQLQKCDEQLDICSKLGTRLSPEYLDTLVMCVECLHKSGTAICQLIAEIDVDMINAAEQPEVIDVDDDDDDDDVIAVPDDNDIVEIKDDVTLFKGWFVIRFYTECTNSYC